MKWDVTIRLNGKSSVYTFEGNGIVHVYKKAENELIGEIIGIVLVEDTE